MLEALDCQGGSGQDFSSETCSSPASQNTSIVSMCKPLVSDQCLLG